MSPRSVFPAASAATAMVCVGSSAAVSQLLVDAPLLTAQAVRYAVACVLLVSFARTTGRVIPRPRGREWLWLIGVAATGMAVFNVAVVRGVAHAEPAAIGVAVASAPVFLAIGGPLLTGRRPSGRLIMAALVVTVGAVLVEGGGRVDLVGFGWAVLTLVCEVGFTLLAAPVLPRLGAWAVSVHTTWIAAVLLGVVGVAAEGPGAVLRLRTDQLASVGYLAVVVTAVAFVCWYSAVARLGADRAGLLTGVAPIVAACGGVLLGGPIPTPAVWAGVGIVAAGIAVGFSAIRGPTRPLRYRPRTGAGSRTPSRSGSTP